MSISFFENRDNMETIEELGFSNVKRVGSGAFGTVYTGTWDKRDGVERAIKVINDSNKAVDELNAYRIISNARKKDELVAKHFPEVEFTGIDPESGKGFIVMELLENDPNARQVIMDILHLIQQL